MFFYQNVFCVRILQIDLLPTGLRRLLHHLYNFRRDQLLPKRRRGQVLQPLDHRRLSTSLDRQNGRGYFLCLDLPLHGGAVSDQRSL